MTIYDISHPHDVRVVMNKPAMTTAELDDYVTRRDTNPDIKRLLLLDVQAQGYQPPDDC